MSFVKSVAQLFRKLWAGFVYITRKLTRRQFLVLLVVLMVLVAGASYVAVRTYKKADKKKDKITYQTEQGPIAPEKLVKLPDTPSSVCQKITAQQVQEAVSEKIEQKTVPLPDGKNAEGTVAGCSYVVSKSDTQKLRSVSINVRTLDSLELAKNNYSRLTQEDGEQVKDLGDQAHFRENANQLVMRKGRAVVVVTVGRLSPDDDIGVDVFTRIAALYK